MDSKASLKVFKRLVFSVLSLRATEEREAIFSILNSFLLPLINFKLFNCSSSYSLYPEADLFEVSLPDFSHLLKVLAETPNNLAA